MEMGRVMIARSEDMGAYDVMNRYVDDIAVYHEERKPVPPQVTERVADLHRMLISSGFLLNLVVDEIPAEVSWAGELQDNTRLYELVEMEHEGGVILVPIFTGLLPEKEDRAGEAQPGHETKRCLACDADIHIDAGNLEGWKQVYRTFPEAWIYGLSDVPYLLMDKCDHDMEYCTRCIRTHLRIRLASGAVARLDDATCPSTGCGRRLEHREIKAYGDENTVKR